jgi:hypothetical protein
VALAFLLLGVGAGFVGGLLWERQARGAPPAGPPPPGIPAARAPGPADLGAQPVAPPPPARATRPPQPPRTAATARAPTGKGRLELKAPAGADVYLDGRKVGRGSMSIPVSAGKHRIEVRLGTSRVAERFEVAPNETWTYEVTPSR